MMLKVGEEEPNSMMKTSVDGGAPAPRKAVWRIPHRNRRVWTVKWTMFRGNMARRGDAAATCGSGRRQGRAQGGGRDRVPRSLRPDGAMQRQCKGRCSHRDDLERAASGRRWTTGHGTTTRKASSSSARFDAVAGEPWGDSRYRVPRSLRPDETT